MPLRLSMTPWLALSGLAFVTLPAAAQSMLGSREYQIAELNELSPEIRAEVLRRATGGNTPRGVLETILLNSMEMRYPGSRIVAVDMGRGVVVIQTRERQLKALTFDKIQALQVRDEVVMQ